MTSPRSHRRSTTWCLIRATPTGEAMSSTGSGPGPGTFFFQPLGDVRGLLRIGRLSTATFRRFQQRRRPVGCWISPIPSDGARRLFSPAIGVPHLFSADQELGTVKRR